METVAKDGPKAYPGSPVLAAKCLDERDRLVLFEKHPQEYDALHNVMKHDDRVQVKRADGYSGALKLAPRSGEQMVVLVDPSYETMRDMDALAEWAPRALRRWPKAVLIIWLPLFRDERELDFGAYLSELTEGAIAGARWPIDPMEETALEGTAMVAYRTSEATGEKMASIASSLQSFWATQNK
jgi:23S rRNA (adenine2030-N6)-methyltransferase